MAVAANGAAQRRRKLERTGIFLHAAGALARRNAVNIGNKSKVLHAGHKFIQIGVIGQKGRHLFGRHRLAPDIVPIYFNGAFRKI